MKGIRNTDISILESILLKIDGAMSFLYIDGSLSYSHIIKHPTDDEFALIIDIEDINMMQDKYPEKLNEIGIELIELIKTLPVDWNADEDKINEGNVDINFP